MQERSNRGLPLLLLVQTLVLAIYTILAMQQEGWNFFEVIARQIGAFSWSGQFTLDFACYLLLVGLWMLWRNGTGAMNLLLTGAAMVAGIVVLAPYLMYLWYIHKGNIQQILLGRHHP